MFKTRKWIHCFEYAVSIIFVVDLACYDQYPLEDPCQNGLMETLRHFDAVVNSRWFMRTSVILLLTNVSEFKCKLAHSPFANYWPDYSGGNDVCKAAKYLLWRFNQVNRAHLPIYPRLTEITDEMNIRLVYAVIRETIFQNRLRNSRIFK
jgi:guanine nucleotide-binding protein G(i) subunit alpha